MSPRQTSQARRTCVDTSAYFALLDADDANHAQARAISHRLIAEGWRLFTTSFVLAETHALLLNRLSQQIATRFLRDMEHSPTTMVWVTPADVQRAKAIIYQYDDKDFSLTGFPIVIAKFCTLTRSALAAAEDVVPSVPEPPQC